MESILENILIISTYIIDLYVIFKFMTIFFAGYSYDKIFLLVAYSIKLAVSGVVAIYASYPLVNLMSYILSIFIITLGYQSKYSKKIITTILIYMCCFVSEAIVALVIGISNFNINQKTSSGQSFAVVLSELILWFITVLLSRFKNLNKSIPIPKAFAVAILVVPVITIVMEILVFQQSEIEDNIAIVSLILTVVINLVMIYLYDSLAAFFKEKTQAGILMAEREYYHEQSVLLQHNYEETRKFRHDIRNRLTVINELLATENYKKAIDYISLLSEKMEDTKMYSKTGNVAIDSIVNYKLTQANKYEIKVTSSITIPQDVEIEDDDIIVVMGNLLDNAIEAAEKCSKNRYINLDIEYEKGCIIIDISNSFDGDVNVVNGKLRTKKNDELLHGIGLTSVKETIEKYSGIANIEYEENDFKVKVILCV